MSSLEIMIFNFKKIIGSIYLEVKRAAFNLDSRVLINLSLEKMFDFISRIFVNYFILDMSFAWHS